MKGSRAGGWWLIANPVLVVKQINLQLNDIVLRGIVRYERLGLLVQIGDAPYRPGTDIQTL